MSITLIAISIDRLIAISKPFLYMNASRRYTYVAIAFCWMAGFFKNWLLKSLRFYKMLMPFHIISFSVFFTIYPLILYKMRKLSKLRSTMNVNSPSVSKKEIRLTKTVFYVVFTYIIFVMPFFICEIASPFENSSKKMRYLGRYLLLCNTAANPFIYYFRLSNARRKIRKFFRIKSLSTEVEAQNEVYVVAVRS